jgi:uncharacterized protein (DUF1015 family)
VPRFEPFVGLRYNPAQVRLDAVIAPPYDVIESAERVRLASRHPANSVLVELPEPDLIDGIDRYQMASQLLAKWRAAEILVPDARPSLYPYRTTAQDGRTSTGIIGALGLSIPGKDSDILPHERTLPKPKSDRLDLLRATQTNLSPIWGLSMTPGLTATFAPVGEPLADAFDDDGVRHQIWVLDDPEAIAAVTTAVGASPVIIADGHHRYETALAYQWERQKQNNSAPGGYDLVMALITELSEDQLQVGPIHRTVSGLPVGTDLPEIFTEWFDVARAGPIDERTVGALGDSQAMALLTPEGAYLLSPRSESYESIGSDLDSSLIAAVFEHLPEHHSVHRHTWREALAVVTSGEAQAAVLLRPVRVDQIAEWAEARRRMPPKTTYFSPKPRTGMVFRTLDG